MFSRSDYLNGVCNHRQYYSQFVTPAVRSRVLNRFGGDLIRRSTDPHFGDIRLADWDILLITVPADIASMIREAEDYPTLAGAVCICKEAAQQLRESSAE